MMHIFGIFNRKQRNSGSSSRPNFKNSVHPAIIKRREVYTVKRAKVKELLGVKTPQECQEVDDLLDRACWRGFLSDQDVESVGSGVTDEIELEFEGLCDHGTRLEPNCSPYCDRIEPMAHDLAQHAHLSSCRFDTSHKRCDEQTAANSTPLDQPIKADIAQPPRLASVSRNKGASTADKGLPLERLTSPHSSRIGSEKMGDCVESFPLPLPFEKHYLPTPRPYASEEASSVAHPLPQPPLTGVKSFDNKDQTSVVRAVSCEPPVKPRLSAREYETIVRAMSCDPNRPMIQKLKGRSLQGLQEVPQTTGSMAVQPRAYQTPQSTPPTTPNHQPSRSLYISPPASSPSSRAHGTPQNTPPRSPCWQSSHVPQGAPPIISRVQCFQTPQNTPPSTPGRQLHSQLLTNKTEKLPLSSSPSRQSPRLKLQLQNQSPVLFTSEQSHYTLSPPSSPLAGSLCPRNWIKGRLLGCGTFGNVYEGHNREDGSFFAVKVSSKEGVSPEIQQELDVLSKLDHPNIVRYLGSSYLGSSIAEKQLCIFLELVTMGSLDFVLKKYKRLEENTIRNYTKQILLGLEYLHRKGTIHRDIKCSNILVDVNGQVKLSDFGIAKQIGESLTASVKGTPLYMAPEVLGSVTDCYSFPADIWSLGCTVLEMADGKPPWSDLPGFAFMFKVKKGELPPLPEHLSLGGRDFIQQCLQLAPKDRPTASELLQHPFVLNAVPPEPLLTRSSPPSPLLPLMWANEESCPISPNRVIRRHQRAQTQLHGR